MKSQYPIGHWKFIGIYWILEINYFISIYNKNMYPIISKIGHFTFYAYGFMLAIAFLVSSTLVRQEAKIQHLNHDIIFNLTFIIFISGIIGARLLYIIENINYYIKAPLEIIKLQHGGLSWFGGLILAIICGIIYLKKNKLSLYKTFDLFVPFVALGQAIGRIGCLLNGCCFGRISKFGLYFAVHKLVLIPTQVYSSLILVIIFIILRFLYNRPHKDGQILYTYLLLYSLKRFIIEFWRGDNKAIFYGLTLFHLASIIIFCIAVTNLILIRKNAFRSKRSNT